MGFAEDARLRLVSAGIVDDGFGGSTGWPCFLRRVFDRVGNTDFHQIVFITEDGGFEPETPSPVGLGDIAFRQPAIQVRVRGEPLDGDAPAEKLQQIMDELHGILRETVGYGLYIRIKAQSEALFIGFDAKNRPEFTQSFRAFTQITQVS
jgi:hypothetical protein